MSIQHPPDKLTSPFESWIATPLHRFSVEEYHRMAEAGAFKPDARVELLDGWLIDMSPIGISHCYVVQQVLEVLSRILPSGWTIYTQRPIILSTSEPQPDLTIVRGSNADYKDHHPGAGDIGLIIEVADSSLGIDRRTKRPIYAAAGIPHYWIVNLVDGKVECCAGPIPQSVAEPASYEKNEVIETAGSLILILDGKQVATIEVNQFFS